jgi:rare lipoprotein A
MIPRKRIELALRLALIGVSAAALTACASVQPRYPSQGVGPPSRAEGGPGVRKIGKPYQVGGIWYVPREQPGYDERGVASWYGQQFHLKATANGETFDMNALTAAHTTLPLPSMVEVTNLDNGRKLVVRVNDRGPFHDNRIIDLSRAAAMELGFHRQGLANVRVRYLGPAPLTGPADGVRIAKAAPLPTRMGASAPTIVRPPAPPAASTAAAGPAGPAYARAPAQDIITASDLPPVTGSAILDTPVVAPAGQMNLAVQPTSALRIQAGAFSNRDNAHRAVSQLSPAGAATIETLDVEGMTLYRVVLPAPADEAAAYALRDRVAQFGFAEARVVRTY